MERPNHRNHSNIDWSRVKESLVYLPGGLILLYGLWLALTV